MTEEHIHNSAGITSSLQVSAIKAADMWAEKIMLNHPEVLATILSRRIKGEIFDLIAEDDALKNVGIVTHYVRKSVAQRVCKVSLASDLQDKIRKGILSKRAAANFTEEGRRKARETLRTNNNWTDEIDSKLLELHSTITHSVPLHAGKPDWVKITGEMQKLFGIELTPHQWHLRWQRVKKLLKTPTS